MKRIRREELGLKAFNLFFFMPTSAPYISQTQAKSRALENTSLEQLGNGSATPKFSLESARPCHCFSAAEFSGRTTITFYPGGVTRPATCKIEAIEELYNFYYLIIEK